MSIEAMRQALVALEHAIPKDMKQAKEQIDAIQALRTAIQEQSNQIPDGYTPVTHERLDQLIAAENELVAMKAQQLINDHVTIPNYPCQEVKEFGERISEAMFEASIRQSMARLGGCKEFRIEDFDENMRPYILAYLEGNFNSTAIIYAAMRTKELELT